MDETAGRPQFSTSLPDPGISPRRPLKAGPRLVALLSAVTAGLSEAAAEGVRLSFAGRASLGLIEALASSASSVRRIRQRLVLASRPRGLRPSLAPTVILTILV